MPHRPLKDCDILAMLAEKYRTKTPPPGWFSVYDFQTRANLSYDRALLRLREEVEAGRLQTDKFPIRLDDGRGCRVVRMYGPPATEVRSCSGKTRTTRATKTSPTGTRKGGRGR